MAVSKIMIYNQATNVAVSKIMVYNQATYVAISKIISVRKTNKSVVNFRNFMYFGRSTASIIYLAG